MGDIKNNDKIIQLAIKLKALADRGVNHERVKAEALLNKLLAKHNMSINDLEIIESKWQEFKVKLYQRNFFNYIVDNVLGTEWEQRQHETKKSSYYVFCSNLEAIEIEGKFEFYWRIFQNDIATFMKAFIRENKLFPKNPEYIEYEKLDEKQREEMARLFGFQRLATKAEYRKQLSAEKPKNDSDSK